jgi:hypothetical protein
VVELEKKKKREITVEKEGLKYQCGVLRSAVHIAHPLSTIGRVDHTQLCSIGYLPQRTNHLSNTKERKLKLSQSNITCPKQKV